MSRTGSRIGYIGIHVRDVDRSIEVYSKALGLKLTGKWTEMTVSGPSEAAPDPDLDAAG